MLIKEATMQYSIQDVKEAIKHIEEVLKDRCAKEKCKRDHLLLKAMLEDLLKILKNKNSTKGVKNEN